MFFMQTKKQTNKKLYWPETFSSSLSSGVIASVAWGVEQSRVSGNSYMTRKALHLETVTCFVTKAFFKHEICNIVGFICVKMMAFDHYINEGTDRSLMAPFLHCNCYISDSNTRPCVKFALHYASNRSLTSLQHGHVTQQYKASVFFCQQIYIYKNNHEENPWLKHPILYISLQGMPLIICVFARPLSSTLSNLPHPCLSPVGVVIKDEAD